MTRGTMSAGNSDDHYEDITQPETKEGKPETRPNQKHAQQVTQEDRKPERNTSENE